MHNLPGYSVYLAEYRNGRIPSAECSAGGAPVFLSLHIREEYSDTYEQEMVELCRRLNDAGMKIVADIEKDTPGRFHTSSVLQLKEKLHLYGVRIDFGFSAQEIAEAAGAMPVIVNASTLQADEARIILARAEYPVVAMHNFYPRPETGLDEEYLKESTAALKALGLQTAAFVPGDLIRRGPLYEGLPTLEAHRNLPPSVGYIDLLDRFGIDTVFVGDPGVSEAEVERMRTFAMEDIIEVPCQLNSGYEDYYDRVFTCRIDSPSWLVRAEESRTYAGVSGRKEAPDPDVRKRVRGSITMDNEKYLRYCGEVQLMRKDLPADPKVNVIGHVQQDYIVQLDRIGRGKKFVLKHV
ncbi:MupG family TIM beta-alpha barrel fold protein [Galactobacillus timonensis]|uniref:MupG family TIM beta-alpha barrel fold protein n=1 Tax=Galactobacillus timonensis TaxID=2041840 RepID=UPI000C866A3F|nr:MupG family TIM beta-alpha barrel fold protein [Galactobacillus timonensis]